MSEVGLQAARSALAGTRAWLVGGAVRDALLGRATADFDVVVAGDPAEAARAVARAGGRAAAFALSEQFGSWRVVARDNSWQVDLERLRAETIEGDLALRDFTVNAIAQPLAGGEPIDPLGGAADLRARRLRVAAPQAFVEDPLRVLRLARVAVELGLQPDEEALRRGREQAEGLAEVSGERIFVELRRTLATPDARAGIELISRLGALAVALPELEALRGIEQSQYHHADVYEHTLEVLDRAIELTGTAGPECTEADPATAPHRDSLAKLLTEPLADGLSRGEGLRWGALLHDVAKPQTREVRAGGRITFMGHDAAGEQLSRAILARLRTSERLRAHVAALVRNHLRLGFLVHEPQPLARRTVYRYLTACAPVAADVSVLSVADRLATRGRTSEQAIDAHLRVADQLIGEALSWRETGPPEPLLRGDELARELAIVPGPQLGRLLDELAEARYAGEVETPEQALAHARAALARR
ncbi:MAG TPA: HDIG domain-containing protein [Solirubrobacteraceae bacterium]